MQVLQREASDKDRDAPLTFVTQPPSAMVERQNEDDSFQRQDRWPTKEYIVNCKCCRLRDPKEGACSNLALRGFAKRCCSSVRRLQSLAPPSPPHGVPRHCIACRHTYI